MLKKTLCLILSLCITVCAVPAYALGDDSDYMMISDAGVEFIKDFEGFSAKPIYDVYGYAIGYGTHIETEDYPEPITEEEGEALMRVTLISLCEEVNQMMYKLGIHMTQSQFDAILSYTYNLGPSWINPDNLIYNMLRLGPENYSTLSIINTFVMYCKSAGEVLMPLAWRRLAEAKLFIYGDYGFGGSPNYDLPEDYVEGETPEMEYTGWYSKCRFSDVTIRNWCYPYLSALDKVGMVSGYDNNTYHPDNKITFGELMKLILDAMGVGALEPTGVHWASGYVSYALDNGILTDDDVEGLDKPVIRLQVAHILANALEIVPIDADSPFSDCEDEDVIALSAAGFMGGVRIGDELVFNPDDYLLRGEMAAILWKMRFGA